MGLLSKKNKPSQKAYAVVTGAGSGIGRSFALELAKCHSHSGESSDVNSQKYASNCCHKHLVSAQTRG